MSTKNNWKEEFDKKLNEGEFGVNVEIEIGGVTKFIESLLADVRSESYTNGYRDGYDQQKKEMIEEILSKAPENNSIYEIDRLIDNNEKYIAGKLVGFNEANEQWRSLLKNHD